MSDTRCWACNKPFEKHPRTKELIFEIVTDPVGAKHKVHKICSTNAVPKEYQTLSSDKKPHHE